MEYLQIGDYRVYRLDEKSLLLREFRSVTSRKNLDENGKGIPTEKWVDYGYFSCSKFCDVLIKILSLKISDALKENVKDMIAEIEEAKKEIINVAQSLKVITDLDLPQKIDNKNCEQKIKGRRGRPKKIKNV
jgi:hypothetical protein